MNVEELKSTVSLFEYYKMLADKTFDQLDDQALFWQYNEASNSIAIIANHMAGNMKSRWTDFLTADGEKEWRNRDQEFEDIIKTREALIEKWEDAWNTFFQALDQINEHNIHSEIYIRNKAHSIYEAIQRQLAHYASHIGQIVYIGKMLKNDEWLSLSIPKGQSKSFNKAAFAKAKTKEHFTVQFKKEQDV